MPEGKKNKNAKGKRKNDEPVGARALKGEKELIQGKIFGPFPFDMQVEGNGELIQIYDPHTAPGSAAYWEYENGQHPQTCFIPKDYKVWVVKAHVAFTPAASQASP